jgi:hypothetical protein
MLLELMVAGSCISQQGCQEMTHAYYLQSKELQVINFNLQDYSNRILSNHQWIVWVGTPMIMTMRGQNAKIMMHENWYLDLGLSNKYVGIQYNW